MNCHNSLHISHLCERHLKRDVGRVIDVIVARSESILMIKYHRISWDTRLVGIKGARGVRKTTLMLQRIKLSFPDTSKALYVSLDDIWFASHTLTDLGDMAEAEGITHLFIDEVHRMPGWECQMSAIPSRWQNLKR